MILVTGATGFVGSHLVKRLASSGRAVRAFVRDKEKAKKLFPNIELAVGDVGDRESLMRAAGGCDAVVHLVGIIQPGRGFSFRSIHVDGTRNVLDAASSAGVRHVVYQSSIGTREGAKSEYHRTKYAAEEMTKASGLEWTITRPSIIIGPWDQFTLRMKSAVNDYPFIPVLGSGKSLFQPVYIGDAVEALARITGNQERFGKVVELCGPRELTMDEMVREIASAMGKNKPISHIPVSFAAPTVYFMESFMPNPPITMEQLVMLQEDNVCRSNTMEELGIEPVDFSEGLRRFLPESP